MWKSKFIQGPQDKDKNTPVEIPKFSSLSSVFVFVAYLRTYGHVIIFRSHRRVLLFHDPGANKIFRFFIIYQPLQHGCLQILEELQRKKQSGCDAFPLPCQMLGIGDKRTSSTELLDLPDQTRLEDWVARPSKVSLSSVLESEEVTERPFPKGCHLR